MMLQFRCDASLGAVIDITVFAAGAAGAGALISCCDGACATGIGVGVGFGVGRGCTFGLTFWMGTGFGGGGADSIATGAAAGAGGGSSSAVIVRWVSTCNGATSRTVNAIASAIT